MGSKTGLDGEEYCLFCYFCWIKFWKNYPPQNSFLNDLTCRVLFNVFTSVMRCFRISEGRIQKHQKVLKVLKASL